MGLERPLLAVGGELLAEHLVRVRVRVRVSG